MQDLMYQLNYVKIKKPHANAHQTTKKQVNVFHI